MDYHIRRLSLFKDLLYLPSDTIPQGFTGERMTQFHTQVDKKNLEPTADQYLCEGSFCGYGLPSNTDGSLDAVLPAGIDASSLKKIPAGTYAFVQRDYDSDKSPLKAAEALWLEFLWEEWEPADDIVYLRELPHGNSTVFQLFRRIQEYGSP